MSRFKITAWLLSVFISLSFASSAQASIDLTDALKQAQHFLIDNDNSGRMLSNVLTGQRCTYDRAGRMEGMAQGAVRAQYSYDYVGRHVGRFVVPKGGAQGFRSFRAFKRAMGPAGKGQAWHHIVEQTPGNVARFGSEAIHNTNNLVK